uniref:Uncharacterized protein n=1 Tax=Rhizophora mucronata TaxID=61149 RepID=A0A2P2K4X0_RHIMU
MRQLQQPKTNPTGEMDKFQSSEVLDLAGFRYVSHVQTMSTEEFLTSIQIAI